MEATSPEDDECHPSCVSSIRRGPPWRLPRPLSVRIWNGWLRQPVLRAGGLQGVEHEAGDGHRTDAAGHRGDGAGHFSHFREGHIADDLGLAVLGRHPIDPHIDDGGVGFDPVAAHHLRLADRRKNEGAAPAYRREVARLGMGNSHRRVLHQEQLRQRLADDVRPPDHNRLAPGQRSMHVLGEHDAGKRRARHNARQAGREQPRRQRMEAVDVLGRRDGLDHLARVDLRRQRQLHENAVNGRVLVQPLDQLQQLDLGGRCRQLEEQRAHIGGGGLGGLAAHIDFARRIVAHEGDCEPGLDAMLLCHPLDGVGDVLAQLGRDGFAVDDACGHCPHLSGARSATPRRCERR